MIKRVTSVFVLALTFSLSAHASLIGDEVRASHYQPISNERLAKDLTIGSGETFGVGYPNRPLIYEASFTGNGVFVDYLNTETWATSSFNGLVVSEIDSVLTNFNISTNFEGWADENLVFNEGTLSANWSGLSFNEDTFFNVTFDVNSVDVPEPISLGLLGLGLAGLGFSRRKKAA